MRDLIKMTCGNCGRANYTTTKNKRTMTEKLEIKKFCPTCRKHFPHKEGKISKGLQAPFHPRALESRCFGRPGWKHRTIRAMVSPPPRSSRRASRAEAHGPTRGTFRASS